MAGQVINATAQNHSNNDHQTECCSPFCTCACCSISVAVAHRINIAFHFPKPEKSYGIYAPEFAFQIASTIWQPPKIS